MVLKEFMATKMHTSAELDQDWPEPAAKRPRRSGTFLGSLNGPEDADAALLRSATAEHDFQHDSQSLFDKEKAIALASTSKHADLSVAPFLARHIPTQYNPLGKPDQPTLGTNKNPNTRFCYRHRPDLKCRRQADEPSMDQLQRDLETLSQEDRQGIAHVWSLFSAAPSKHRNLMLQGILAQCCFPQLSYLSGNIKDLIRIDFLSALPAEISYKILCYLDTTSLCKAAQVSRRWRQLADDDVVWHRMCEQHIDRKCTKCGWGLPLLERKRLRATKRQIQLRATGRGLNQWSPEITPQPEEKRVATSDDSTQIEESTSTSTDAGRDEGDHPLTRKRPALHHTETDTLRRTRPWKEVYKDRFKVGTNWKYGRYKLKVFKGHTNGVMCLQFLDNILATGSYDAKIKIWDLETGNEIRTLHGHEKGIRCLQFDDTKLISGSLDNTIRVWNWRTGECISQYHGHEGGVIGLHFDGNLLASGSVDQKIKIWNFQDKTVFSLCGHKEWVNSVKIDSLSRTVFSASDDCTVRLWDLDTRSVIRVFKGHVGQVQQVLPLPREFELDEEELNHNHEHSDDDESPESSTTELPPLLHRVLSNSSSRSLGEPTINGDFDRPSPPKYMLTGALDNTIRLWDTATGRCIRTFWGHVEGIWALAADTLRLVSGAEDGMVKVWDPRTGKCDMTLTGHRGPATCVALGDWGLASGGEDGEIRVYSFKST